MTKFKDIEMLEAHTLASYEEKKGRGGILLPYRNSNDYEGMVQGMMILYNSHNGKYLLDLQWISFGLDLYGEDLLENYLYEFKNLEMLLDYLLKKYKIKVTDIPVDYEIDESLYPNPIADADEKEAFKSGWSRFQQDFKKGLFLDKSLKLVYSTGDERVNE